jgi:uncharacterized membrane protein YeiB
LTLFGIVNGYIYLWWGDILYAYGSCVTGCLFPFRKEKTAVLNGYSIRALALMALRCLFRKFTELSYSRNPPPNRRADYLAAI